MLTYYLDSSYENEGVGTILTPISCGGKQEGGSSHFIPPQEATKEGADANPGNLG